MAHSKSLNISFNLQLNVNFSPNFFFSDYLLQTVAELDRQVREISDQVKISIWS
jgi:hypothetical protein